MAPLLFYWAPFNWAPLGEWEPMRGYSPSGRADKTLGVLPARFPLYPRTEVTRYNRDQNSFPNFFHIQVPLADVGKNDVLQNRFKEK